MNLIAFVFIARIKRFRYLRVWAGDVSLHSFASCATIRLVPIKFSDTEQNDSEIMIFHENFK